MLNQLPEQSAVVQSTLTPATLLVDMIDHPEVVVSLQVTSSASAKKENRPDTALCIHSYINSDIDRVAVKSGVSERLTSHSCQRGREQHAHGAGLCVQWIFDRGEWNMTSTNKAFVYIFNTSSEEHKDAQILSGRHPNTIVSLLSLDFFDSDT